jgi:Rrf2 family protein
LKLTTKSEYSLLTLLYLARCEPDRHVPLEEVCNACSIPRKYLEQLAQVLKQNRLIKARRGNTGGYQLARPAEEITLAEVIRLMDGALAPTESVSRYFFEVTPISQEKKLVRLFREIRDYIADRMEDVTLADLV